MHMHFLLPLVVFGTIGDSIRVLMGPAMVGMFGGIIPMALMACRTIITITRMLGICTTTDLSVIRIRPIILITITDVTPILVLVPWQIDVLRLQKIK